MYGEFYKSIIQSAKLLLPMYQCHTNPLNMQPIIQLLIVKHQYESVVAMRVRSLDSAVSPGYRRFKGLTTFKTAVFVCSLCFSKLQAES